MFVTALENRQLRLHQNQSTFQKFIAFLWEGLIHELKHILLAPYVSKQLTALFHTQPLLISFVYSKCGANSKLCILVKVQPSTQTTWPQLPTRLGIRLKDLGLPSEYSLGHYDLSPASRHKHASTSRHYSLLTATSHDSTLLNSFLTKKLHPKWK